MVKKKARLSLFSTIVQQINEHDTKISPNEYHLIDNEYFPAFNSIDDIEQFHNKLIEKQQEQSINIDEDVEHDTNYEMDMKSFAQQFLVDLPENLNLSQTSSQDLFTADQPINWSPNNKKRKSTTPMKRNIEINNKRQRRNIRDLPQSSDFIFNDNHKSLNSSTNIFDYVQKETSENQIESGNMNSILFTLNDKQSINNESSIAIELAEPSIIKNEPIESDMMTSTASMGFNTSEYSGGLDNYVQNIHLLHVQPTSVSSLRPKRIRKQKKFYNDESESIPRSKKVKPSFRKKRSSQNPSNLHLTDAEIEQQFGERLPIVKQEQDDNTQQIINSRVIIEFEPVNHPSPQTPIEKARAKLMMALGRGHDPDTYLLKIRSREHKIIEVQLAIYSTADWYSHRTRILSKIEEALRGLRVSWTKIDIHVDDFDVQISTSSTITPPSSTSATNSSWFLKALSESNPLIVHIHDRRYPQQRFLIKCSCPECSPTFLEQSLDSSLPVIVNVSPSTTPTRRLTPPSILNKTHPTNISSLHNIDTTFFNELISEWGRNIIISVTQCVLDLALIVSVHTSLSNLHVASKDEFKNQYQQIIDPLKCTFHENEQNSLSKTPRTARVVSTNLSKSPDILTFYNSIKQNKANIRSAKSMRNLILTSPSESTNLSHRPDKYSRTYFDTKQQAHCTPIIELKPIMGGSTITTQNIHSFTKDKNESIVIRDSQNNELKKVTTIISQEVNPSGINSARVIRFSIAKSALTNSTSPPTIRLVPSPKTDSDMINKSETIPLVPKQINIIKPFTSSSSITPAIKLSNPILISKSTK